MTVIFTDEEMKWITKEKFNWQIKKDCPEKLKGKIQKKLNNLYSEKQGD